MMVLRDHLCQRRRVHGPSSTQSKWRSFSGSTEQMFEVLGARCAASASWFCESISRPSIAETALLWEFSAIVITIASQPFTMASWQVFDSMQFAGSSSHQRIVVAPMQWLY
ncbi:hypothetical protein C8Q74DRAFT_638779 [Fomes fomentarius]|nr:hypothetical protein C8Q74DRAFT_638779 [Fomes fomentarius]